MYQTLVRPICIPTMSNTNYFGKKVNVAGWGITVEKDFIDGQTEMAYDLDKEMAYVLQYADNLKHVECNELAEGASKRWGEQTTNEDPPLNHLCAFHPDVDACSGDSGGPLFTASGKINSNGKTKYAQYGVVSRGAGCGKGLVPGVYMDVRRYVDWIKSHAKFIQEV